ncbi:MAG: triose-phosphate isomerase, partial [Planctomycetota bacterium]|nr:triose-phosphate isomerase [Planctomycetota bacterium]
MSRRRIIAGNWKMNMRLDTATALAKGVAESVGENPEVDVVLCPPSTYLS